MVQWFMMRGTEVIGCIIYLLIFGVSGFAQEIQTPPAPILPAPLSARPQTFPPPPIEAPSRLPEILSETPSSASEKPSLSPSAAEKGMPKGVEEAPIQEAPSSIEQYFRGKVSGEISTDIVQFGHDLFSVSPSRFTPADKVPVGPEYVIGPGDEIRITVWGKVEGKWTVVVDRDGNIALPKVGILGVTGLTFKELKGLLYKEFSQYYASFDMNVSMGTLRTIKVYVVGNAKKPGAYTISSVSTLVNALFDVGGPSKTGGMRGIQVKRGGKTVVHFDLYDLLLRGDKTRDIRLMPEDVIFIPPIGPVAAIAGHVKRAAIYELAGETRIVDLVDMAGGVTAAGYLQRIQLERVYEHEVKIVVDKNLKELNGIENLVLKDGDMIKVFPISHTVVNAVTLEGNVVRPGRYQWVDGMKVSDIIKNTDKDLLVETYFDHALIERSMPPDYHREIISFNLGKVVFDKDTAEDKLLQPRDILTVYSIWEFLEKPKVRIAGAANRPGEFELRRNMTVSDLVNLAGGVKRYAFLDEAELTRIHITNAGPKTENIRIKLKAALSKEADDLPLLEDDYLFIRSVPEWQFYRAVSIAGEVKFPGTYMIKSGERLSALITRAGGFTDKAYLKGAVFTRKNVQEQQQRTIDEMASRLERELLGVGSAKAAVAVSSEEAAIQKAEVDQKRRFIESLKAVKAKGRVSIVLLPPDKLQKTPYDITLEDGDTIHVPEDPKVVQVIGSVFNQNAYVYDRGKSVSDYIDLSGGYTEDADTKRPYIIKADGRATRPRTGFSSLLGWMSGHRDVESGDTVVVPIKLERTAWLREIKDITQILYQIAVTAGVLIVSF